MIAKTISLQAALHSRRSMITHLLSLTQTQGKHISNLTKSSTNLSITSTFSILLSNHLLTTFFQASTPPSLHMESREQAKAILCSVNTLKIYGNPV